MPAPSSAKRVRHIQIHRPFLFGSEAIPFDPSSRPPDAPPDHTHKWRIFVRGLPNPSASNSSKTGDVSYWLRRVQFKLHDTYAQSLRTVDAPGPFEVEETGWGEFEVAIKFYFVPESGEKPQQLWHALKLHPYIGDQEEIDRQKRERSVVKSICYEEVVFSEPYEAFYNILTGGAKDGEKSGKSGKAKSGAQKAIEARTAELPERNEGGNVWSREEESKELDRLGEAVRRVEKLIGEEKERLIVEEKRLMDLKETEGGVTKKR